jgi:hypothetical protein
MDDYYTDLFHRDAERVTAQQLNRNHSFKGGI